jgi:hypothetical protein
MNPDDLRTQGDGVVATRFLTYAPATISRTTQSQIEFGIVMRYMVARLVNTPAARFSA